MPAALGGRVVDHPFRLPHRRIKFPAARAAPLSPCVFRGQCHTARGARRFLYRLKGLPYRKESSACPSQQYGVINTQQNRRRPAHAIQTRKIEWHFPRLPDSGGQILAPAPALHGDGGIARHSRPVMPGLGGNSRFLLSIVGGCAALASRRGAVPACVHASRGARERPPRFRTLSPIRAPRVNACTCFPRPLAGRRHHARRPGQPRPGRPARARGQP